jgi:hypothetical protein
VNQSAEELRALDARRLQLEYEDKLIERIRAEASEVKDCFTRYSFQSIALVSAILGIAFRPSDTSMLWSGFVGIPLAILLMTVASIGTHKYATANRLLGYELHLQRTARYSSESSPGWHVQMRSMGWEEGMRAWRIVQATVFNYLFKSHDLRKSTGNVNLPRRMVRWIWSFVTILRIEQLPRSLRNSEGKLVLVPEERWFETRSHMLDGMAYYPGGYLHTILNVVYLVAALCIVFAASVGAQLFHDGQQAEGLFAYSAVLVIMGICFKTLFHSYRRRTVLEEGFLSINSCAVLWQIIACAHFVTLHRLRVAHGGVLPYYKDYSRTLGEIARDFADHVFDPYAWLQKMDPSVRAAFAHDPQDQIRPKGFS